MDARQLDTQDAQRSVWLVKVPANVAARWKDACEQTANIGDDRGPELGRVRCTSSAAGEVCDALVGCIDVVVEINGCGVIHTTWHAAQPCCPTQEAAYSMVLTGPSSADLPVKAFNMNAATEMQPTHIVAEDPNRIAVIGKVDRKFDLTVNADAKDGAIDAGVRALNRQRNVEASTKTRLLRVIGDPKAVSNAPLPGANRAMLRQAIADRKNKESNKRVRIEKDDLEHMLFKLFEKTPYWTLQQLQKQLEQPTSYLKEVLTEIAVVNKKGPNKDKWELKKEYKKR